MASTANGWVALSLWSFSKTNCIMPAHAIRNFALFNTALKKTGLRLLTCTHWAMNIPEHNTAIARIEFSNASPSNRVLARPTEIRPAAVTPATIFLKLFLKPCCSVFTIKLSSHICAIHLCHRRLFRDSWTASWRSCNCSGRSGLF